MKRANNVLELIGATPIVRLGRVVEPGAAEVWGKLEAVNPGGSVKDRIALAMIEAAETDHPRTLPATGKRLDEAALLSAAQHVDPPTSRGLVSTWC